MVSMSRRNALRKQEAREKHQARVKLVAGLVGYWFARQYPCAYALDPDNDMQRVMSDEEIKAIQDAQALALWTLPDAQLQRMVEATLKDYMACTPLRDMRPRAIRGMS